MLQSLLASILVEVKQIITNKHLITNPK